MQLQEWYIARAYNILSDAKPIDFDCGLLCHAKCCKGNSQDGMLLFPGEEKRFENKIGFVINDTPLGKTLICSGTCERNQRPLACRIFPLFPYVSKGAGRYKISVLRDVRAVDYCPLCDLELLPEFERKIRLATRSLLRDPECAAFLLQLTSEFTDVGNF
ncbi:MAG: hypothetical protein IJC45_11120 [Clostridia bacterium]|nr:hypothetical protein [Clostridia bacterium]